MSILEKVSNSQLKTFRNYLCSRNRNSDEPPTCSVCKCNETEIPEPWKIQFESVKKQNPFSKFVKPWNDEQKNLWFPKQDESSNFQKNFNF
jgi:hypothetical protein